MASNKKKSKKAWAGAPKGQSKMKAKDILVGFFLEGSTALEQIHEKGMASKIVLQKALKILQTSESEQAEEFARFMAEHYPPATRGRGAPGPGDARNYKAQKQGKAEQLFLRIPLPPVSEAGEQFRTEFEDDKIIIFL